MEKLTLENKDFKPKFIKKGKITTNVDRNAIN